MRDKVSHWDLKQSYTFYMPPSRYVVYILYVCVKVCLYTILWTFFIILPINQGQVGSHNHNATLWHKIYRLKSVIYGRYVNWDRGVVAGLGTARCVMMSTTCILFRSSGLKVMLCNSCAVKTGAAILIECRRGK